MTPAPRIAEILNQYRRLTAYCDEFFARVQNTHAHEMSCASGCSACCTLQTVCGLEAAVIADHVSRRSDDVGPVSAGSSPGVCPLLRDGRCRVYDSRPVICRTHGLLLPSNGGTASSCGRNFACIAPGEIAAHDLLDNERITMNLMKLNLAYNMEIGRREAAEARFDLYDVVAGKLPREFVV